MQIYSNKLFEQPVDIIETNKNTSIKDAFLRIEKYRKNHYLVGFINYDFNSLYFEVFDKFSTFIPNFADKNSETPIGIFTEAMISKEKYLEDINKIKEYIANGISYEVNYTYPHKVKSNLNDFELYQTLLEKQTTPYNAFLKSKTHTILSFSPELFFKLEKNKIITKPMKGTIARGSTKEEDAANKTFLYNDIKNRAENVMIVDLLRNDLGRIAKTGSVQVDNLFEIEEHKTLFQMTSQISAELEENTTLLEIFESIFPCGSITGAPKLSTMRIINELEDFNREFYCGAIGIITPDYCEFSVPIRILQKQNNQDFYKYFVGGAIVWDSDAESEWEETLVKKKLLDYDFHLIETGKDNWNAHIKRLKNSAKELRFIWNSDIENFYFEENAIYRIMLFRNGKFEIQNIGNKMKDRPNNLIKITRKVNSKNIFLYHKTSIREKLPEDCYDNIALNEKDEITEGIFTNIVIEKDNKLFTPPVSSGLLNGTLRDHLIKTNKLNEKILHIEDLQNADKIFCINSIRGIVEVKLC